MPPDLASTSQEAGKPLTMAAARRRRRPLRFALKWSVLTGIAGAVAALTLLLASTHGYRALVREDVVAVVRTRPTGPQQFHATFVFPDGLRHEYALAGDQIYVDARILKWRPIVNFLGLHTAYRLDRVAGRYVDVEDERSRPRTVFALGEDRKLDIFDLRRSYPILSPLVDAEYGSATFVAADEISELELRVSTTGLLLRGVSARFAPRS